MSIIDWAAGNLLLAACSPSKIVANLSQRKRFNAYKSTVPFLLPSIRQWL